ncbi:hypothetical protein DFH06DRAFT_1137729 [Mycena polygramma]|nr:hypothetical protein DFH06DRAFT_1137729 [Mycena polygramma]
MNAHSGHTMTTDVPVLPTSSNAYRRCVALFLFTAVSVSYPCVTEFPITRACGATFLVRAAFCAATIVWSRKMPYTILLSGNLFLGILAALIHLDALPGIMSSVVHSRPTASPATSGQMIAFTVILSSILSGLSFWTAALVRSTDEEVAQWWESILVNHKTTGATGSRYIIRVSWHGVEAHDRLGLRLFLPKCGARAQVVYCRGRKTNFSSTKYRSGDTWLSISSSGAEDEQEMTVSVCIRGSRFYIKGIPSSKTTNVLQLPGGRTWAGRWRQIRATSALKLFVCHLLHGAVQQPSVQDDTRTECADDKSKSTNTHVLFTPTRLVIREEATPTRKWRVHGNVDECRGTNTPSSSVSPVRRFRCTCTGDFARARPPVYVAVLRRGELRLGSGESVKRQKEEGKTIIPGINGQKKQKRRGHDAHAESGVTCLSSSTTARRRTMSMRWSELRNG